MKFFKVINNFFHDLCRNQFKMKKKTSFGRGSSRAGKSDRSRPDSRGSRGGRPTSDRQERPTGGRKTSSWDDFDRSEAPRERREDERKPVRNTRPGGRSDAFTNRSDDRRPSRSREEGNDRPGRSREDGDRPSFSRGRSSERSDRGFSRDNDRRPTRSREEGGDRPFRSREGDNDRPFRSREGGNDRPFRSREGGNDRPFRSREGGNDRPFRSREGGNDRPFRSKEGGDDRPFRSREGGDDRPSFNRGRSGDRPERGFGREDSRSRDDKPSFSRGGDRSFSRDDDRRPARRRDDDNDRPAPRRDDGDRPSYSRGRSNDKPEGRFNRDDDRRPSRRREDGDAPRSFNDNEFSDRPKRESFGSDDRPRSAGRGRRPNPEQRHEHFEKKYASRDGGRKSAPRKRNASTGPDLSGEIRLNRFISMAGIGSRREADDLITAGLITVNGTLVTELGSKVKPGDDVRYNGERIRNEKHVYLLLNKPKDYITTADDPNERKTVMELIEGACPERVYPVGRLDRNTTGLLLFTNDGDVARYLTHPSSHVKKIYSVELDKNLKVADMKQLLEGVELEDGISRVDDIAFDGDGSDKKSVGVELHSGKNRVVRRLFEALGYDVKKLDRVGFAGLTKKDLPRGRWRFLDEKEIGFLKMTGNKKKSKQLQDE